MLTVDVCVVITAIGPRWPRWSPASGQGSMWSHHRIQQSQRCPQGQTTDRERSGGPSGEILDIHCSAIGSIFRFLSVSTHACDRQTALQSASSRPQVFKKRPTWGKTSDGAGRRPGRCELYLRQPRRTCRRQRCHDVTSWQRDLPIRSGLREQRARSVYSPWSRDTIPLRSRLLFCLVFSQAQRHSAPL